MIATNTYGGRVSTPRIIAIAGWLVLGLAYVTMREIAANLGGWLGGSRTEAPTESWHTSGPLLFPPS